MRTLTIPFALVSLSALLASTYALAVEELTYSRNLSIIALDVLPGMPSSFQNLTCHPVKTDPLHAVYVCDITMGTDNQPDVPSEAQTSRFVAADLPEHLTGKAAQANFIFGIRSSLTDEGIRTYPVYISVDKGQLSPKDGQDLLEAFKEDFAHWFAQADKAWKKSLAKAQRKKKPDFELRDW